MEEDFDEDYIEENNYSEEDEYEYSSKEESEYGSETDSEIYQPKIEKKVESILKSSSRNIIIVPPEERITDNRLHKNEVSFIISTRAKEIAKHSTHFLGQHNYTNVLSIAYHELYEHKCPFKLRRQVGTTSKGDIIVEEWDVKTMVLPNIFVKFD
jgi:DNA-directed RNA polymerase subunit K/omega